MTIAEMHVWFRQYAQQMGMQNVRAILPEQIDVLINTSITDTVNQLIRDNIGLTNDRVITDNSKIGQINALRTLYKVEEIDLFSVRKIHTFNNFTLSDSIEDYPLTCLFYKGYDANKTLVSSIQINSREDVKIIEKASTEDFIIRYISHNDSTVTFSITTNSSVEYTQVDFNKNDGTSSYSTYSGASGNTRVDTRIFLFDDESVYTGLLKGFEPISNYMFLVDFALNYTKVDEGYSINAVNTINKLTGDLAFTTNYFPVRLIDDAYLADTLNDFVLKPRLRSPILTIYNGNRFDLYIESFIKYGSHYALVNGLLPYKFRCSYIKRPAIVRYAEDVNGINVDCDLPESMHVDILKHAVDLYRIAVSGALQGAQQQQQQAQQENVRNNARDEGYQQRQQ